MSVTTSLPIHPTAIVHPTAQVGEDVEIGPYAVIGDATVLGRGVRVGPHAVIEFADIGEGCQIHPHAFVGTAPQDLKYRGEPTRLILGPGTIVRECATLNRGTAASGATRIGARCLLMAYVHIAHDCVLGDGVIMANYTALAGHVTVEEEAVLSSHIGVHQFTRIGRLAMIGAGAMVAKDIPPFTTAWGDRVRLAGLNLVGLRRRNFPSKTIQAIRKAYKILITQRLPLEEALRQLDQTDHGLAGYPEVQSSWIESRGSPSVNLVGSLTFSTRKGSARRSWRDK
ncbi:MAG: acyl-ACP--UDP-N-acetylglucosamine O-acyltransferase [Elusimicrobia bacterium]|nr:acyl-ACP--UDP-N-acetylglucosamine O-acyltransferase [Elusimicrobiota bacterium]